MMLLYMETGKIAIQDSLWYNKPALSAWRNLMEDKRIPARILVEQVRKLIGGRTFHAPPLAKRTTHYLPTRSQVSHDLC